MTKSLNVGMVGYKFMGKAHSNAYRQVAAFFPDLALKPELKAICGRNESAVQSAAEQLGWQGYETDWKTLVNRPDIDLIDISTPGDSHVTIALAAAEQGKHILCEKPLANTLTEARSMLKAVQQAGVIGMVCFNYRRVPAVQLAKRLIESGKLGRIYHWRAVYLQDWLVNPQAPLTWRMNKDQAGSGSLGDLGAHIIDLSRYLLGEIDSVTGLTETFVKQRPTEAGGSTVGEVSVDDAALFLARFANGAIGSFEATRFANGRINYNSFEINGSKGSIRFNLERLNELEVLLEDDQADIKGFRSVLATDPLHPYMQAWWPSGHIIGWEHTFTHTVYDLIQGIANKQNPAASFEDGVRCQAVLEAVVQSAGSKQWVEPEYE